MKIIRFLMPRIEYILFAAIFWGIASTGPLLLNADGDLPRHLLVGQLIRQTQTVHTTDIFSFRTVGFPSIPHEWLAQVIFSIFNDWLGLAGVVLLTSAIVTIAWVILYYDAQQRSGSLISALLFTVLGISASLIHIVSRPHLFSYILIAVWVICLERLRNNRLSRWWLLPLIMLLWVNLHGMFIMGIAIWIVYLVGSWFENPTRTWLTDPRTKIMFLGGFFSLLATFLSPSGAKIWETIASLGGNAYITSNIAEYQSADFHTAPTWPFVILLQISLILFSRLGEKLSWTHTFLMAAFAGLGLYSSRMLPLFAIVAVPILSQVFAQWLKSDFPNSRLLTTERNLAVINQTANGAIWVVGVVFVLIFLFKYNIPIDFKNKGNQFDPEFFPVEAVKWLETNPQNGNVFNEFDWGGYMLLKLWPTYPIFMDGHTHIYGEELTREYADVLFLQTGWEAILAKYEIQWAILRAESRLGKTLQDTGWQVLYKDGTAIILHHP